LPTSPDLNGHHNYWVGIDVAAAALDVTIPTAYVIAKRDAWRRTSSKPRGYLMADIRNTAQKRHTKETR
jgi:hypothetical protein